MNYRDTAYFTYGISVGMLLCLLLGIGLVAIVGEQMEDLINGVEINNPSLVVDFNQTKAIEDLNRVYQENNHFERYNYTQSECTFAEGYYMDGGCYFK